MVKSPPAMQETRFSHWLRMIPWRRKWLSTHILACRTPWTEEAGGLQSTGLIESDTTDSFTFTFTSGNVEK